MRAFLFSLVLVFAGLPAAATINCKTADLTTLLLSLQLDLIENVDAPATHVRRIARALASRPDHIGPWVSDPTADADTQAVMSLIALSYDLISSDGKSSTLSLMLRSEHGLAVRRMATIAVLRAACATSVGDRSSQDAALGLSDTAPKYSRTAQGSTGSTLSSGWGRLSPAVQTTIGVGSVAMIVLGIIVSRQLYRIRALTRRRRHRYSVNHIVHLSVGGDDKEGRLIDLNCFGLKLQHDGGLPPSSETADVQIQEKWHRIRIVWQNAHYAGGTFAKPLGLTELLLIVASSAKVTKVTRKRAVT